MVLLALIRRLRSWWPIRIKKNISRNYWGLKVNSGDERGGRENARGLFHDWFLFWIWLERWSIESLWPTKERSQTNLSYSLKNCSKQINPSRIVGQSITSSLTQFIFPLFRWFSSPFTIRGICSNRRRQKHRKHHVPIMHADNTWSGDPSQDVYGRTGAETLGSVTDFKGQETIKVIGGFFLRHFFRSFWALVDKRGFKSRKMFDSRFRIDSSSLKKVMMCN